MDLDPNEKIEADNETLHYADEDWENPEQIEVFRNMEPDLPFSMQTRQSARAKPANSPYGDDFLVDRIDLKKVEDLEGSGGDNRVTGSRPSRISVLSRS